MVKEKEWYRFIQRYAMPVFIVNISDDTVIFSNKKAEHLYNISTGSSNLSKILKDVATIDYQEVQKSMRANAFFTQYDIYTVTSENKIQLADMQADYFDEEKTKVLVEIRTKEDLRLEMAQHQVNQSIKAEAILDYDSSFTFFYCNDIFSEFLDIVNPSHISKKGLGLADSFQAEEKERILESIHRKLESKQSYSHDLEITTSNGELKWVKLYLHRRELGMIGEKVMCSLVCIDHYKEQEVELGILNQYLSVMQEFSDDILYRVDVPRKILYHEYKNSTMLRINSVIPNYLETLIEDKTIHPDDVPEFLKTSKAWHKDESIISEVRLRLVSEEYKWYRVKRRKVLNEQGDLVEILGALVNIHKEREILEDFTELDQYFSVMQSLSDDILFHIDLVNQVFTNQDQTIVAMDLSAYHNDFSAYFISQGVVHPEDVESYRSSVAALLKGDCTNYQARFEVAEGVYEWFDIRCEFILDSEGTPLEIFGRSRNIQYEKDMELRATRDYLTKVYNRNTFEYKMNQTLAESPTGAYHALVFIDMDDFKSVNDNYGHQFGDFVLEKFAQRINNCIRETDFLGRIGGDEFVVYLKNVKTKEMALERANTMLDRLKKPIGNGTYSHKLGASIGIALVPDDGASYEELYRHADKAVYESKRQGKNIATVYTEDLENSST